MFTFINKIIDEICNVYFGAAKILLLKRMRNTFVSPILLILINKIRQYRLNGNRLEINTYLQHT